MNSLWQETDEQQMVMYLSIHYFYSLVPEQLETHSLLFFLDFELSHHTTEYFLTKL